MNGFRVHRVRILAPATALLVSLVTLSACFAHPSKDADRGRAPHPVPSATFHVPTALGPGRVLLIDRYSNTLAIYDIHKGAISAEDTRPQSFSYAMPGGTSTLISVGNSLGGEFTLYRMKPTGATKIATFPYGVFPAAGEEGREVVLVQKYAPDGTVNKTYLGKLTGTSLKPIAGTEASVRSAAIAGGRLWYTVNRGEGKPYALYSLPWPRSSGNANLERKEPRTPQIFSAHRRLVIDGSFSPKLTKVDCSQYCRLDHQGDHVFSLTVKDQSLTLTCWSMETGVGKTLARGDIVDFAEKKRKVVVYMRSGVVTTPGCALP